MRNENIAGAIGGNFKASCLMFHDFECHLRKRGFKLSGIDEEGNGNLRYTYLRYSDNGTIGGMVIFGKNQKYSFGYIVKPENIQECRVELENIIQEIGLEAELDVL